MVKTGHPMEWETFEDFMRWCKGTYTPGTRLVRINDTKPYSPNNCKWETMQLCEAYRRKLAAQWDAVMEPIRKRYRMQIAEEKANEKEYFRYEHPDLVREGIVFESTYSV